MSDEGAAAVLAAAAMAALREAQDFSSVSDGAAIQAGDAAVQLDMGPETDWGHKSGEGAEIRFALLIRCGGERPGRARSLADAARARIGALGGDIGGWHVVSLAMMRSRTVRDAGPRWTAVVEYRARLLRG